MSDYSKGDWEQVWNGLFWRFIYVHQDYFGSNPRTSMLVHSYNRMSKEKQIDHLKNAEIFIQNKYSMFTNPVV
jgi:deoxyribodipyrimidine photolyase-related protein